MKSQRPIFTAGRMASAAISILVSSVLNDPFQYAQKGLRKLSANNGFQKIK